MAEENKFLSTVQIHPQEYEWVCPQCELINFIVGERLPEIITCCRCEANFNWELPSRSKLTRRGKNTK